MKKLSFMLALLIVSVQPVFAAQVNTEQPLDALSDYMLEELILSGTHKGWLDFPIIIGEQEQLPEKTVLSLENDHWHIESAIARMLQQERIEQRGDEEQRPRLVQEARDILEQRRRAREQQERARIQIQLEEFRRLTAQIMNGLEQETQEERE